MGEGAEVIKLFGDKVRNAVVNADGFFNRVSGLGTSRDKSAYTAFRRNRELTEEELDALYSDNSMASRVCDVVPDEELRQGYEVIVDPTEGDTSDTAPEDAAQMGVDVKDAADVLGLQPKTIEARVWGRVFGGGGLHIGVNGDSENLAEPIDLARIQSVDFINVLERRYMWPSTFYDSPIEAKVGQVRTYLVSPNAASSRSGAFFQEGTVEIHESRIVVFGGSRTTIRRRQENNGWDQSILQRMQTTITRYGTSFATLGHIIQDANQGVYKMEGFLEALAANETNVVMKRMEMMDMARSAVRSVVLDAEGEEFERQNFTWSGIKEPFELLMLDLSADARMPVTVLMGQSPSGMDATGESDMRWFYDTIASSQENIVKPALEYVLRLIFLSKNGPTNGVEPDSWGIKFPSLWQPTPLEASEIEMRHAQSDQIYNVMGAANADEIATSRFTEGGFERTLNIDLPERRANMAARSIEGDIEATPTGIVDLQSDIAAARSMTAMQEIALQVQSGQITPESGGAIVIASTVGLTFEQALAIVGEPDPIKVAARAAMATGLAGGDGEPPGDGDGDDEPQPNEPEPADPEVEENADAKHDPEEDEERRRKREAAEKAAKAKAK